jgi:hypothetical protein
MTEIVRESIRQQYAGMMKTAEEQGLWFFAAYQGLWFSPKELRSEQFNGQFNWSPGNFVLRNPLEMIEEQQRRVDRESATLESLRQRLHNWKLGR